MERKIENTPEYRRVRGLVLGRPTLEMVLNHFNLDKKHIERAVEVARNRKKKGDETSKK